MISNKRGNHTAKDTTKERKEGGGNLGAFSGASKKRTWDKTETDYSKRKRRRGIPDVISLDGLGKT